MPTEPQLQPFPSPSSTPCCSCSPLAISSQPLPLVLSFPSSPGIMHLPLFSFLHKLSPGVSSYSHPSLLWMTVYPLTSLSLLWMMIYPLTSLSLLWMMSYQLTSPSFSLSYLELFIWPPAIIMVHVQTYAFLCGLGHHTPHLGALISPLSYIFSS